MRALVLHAHPLEDSFSVGVRDVVCAALDSEGVDYTLVKLAQGEEADLLTEPFEHLIAVSPTWWGGSPAVLLDWLQRTLGPYVDGSEPKHSSPLTSIQRVTVVTTHGSSQLVNSLQGEPGKQTWKRVVMPCCGADAKFEWVSLYKIDRTTEAERSAFLDRVRDHFTNDRVSV
ncbi:MAG: NAD(P)H-dependent oxidoreductase [Acidimicrobiales bacterium]